MRWLLLMYCHSQEVTFEPITKRENNQCIKIYVALPLVAGNSRVSSAVCSGAVQR